MADKETHPITKMRIVTRTGRVQVKYTGGEWVGFAQYTGPVRVLVQFKDKDEWVLRLHDREAAGDCRYYTCRYSCEHMDGSDAPNATKDLQDAMMGGRQFIFPCVFDPSVTDYLTRCRTMNKSTKKSTKKALRGEASQDSQVERKKQRMGEAV